MAVADEVAERGKWFSKKVYTPEWIQTFAEGRERLPRPIKTECIEHVSSSAVAQKEFAEAAAPR